MLATGPQVSGPSLKVRFLQMCAGSHYLLVTFWGAMRNELVLPCLVAEDWMTCLSRIGEPGSSRVLPVASCPDLWLRDVGASGRADVVWNPRLFAGELILRLPEDTEVTSLWSQQSKTVSEADDPPATCVQVGAVPFLLPHASFALPWRVTVAHSTQTYLGDFKGFGLKIPKLCILVHNPL